MKVSFFFLMMGLNGLSAVFADEERIVSPKLTSHQDAIMPLKLHDNRICDPKAKVWVTISEEGTVTDSICTYADDYRIAEIAESLALGYKFRPATLNGEAISVLNEVVINFEYESKYNTNKDGFSNMIDFIGESDSSKFQLHSVSPNELDRPLEIVESTSPMLIKNKDGAIELGQALIEGYVDLQGDLRFMSVKEADSPYIAEAALGNLSHLRFAPPRKNGQRVVCRVQIPFVAQSE